VFVNKPIQECFYDHNEPTLCMGKIGKTFTLILTLVIAMSSPTLLVNLADAQTIPSPSVPEFTVSFVDRSYTVPITTTQTTDPFTGQQVTQTNGGQYVKNETVEIKIKNPQSTSVTLSNGSVAQLYYSVRTKGHFSDRWGEPYDDRWTTTWANGDSFAQVFASTSDYTVVTLVRGSPNDILMGYADVYIPSGGQEDFQVQASFGYQYTTFTGLYPSGTAFFSYAYSGWSNTKTISTLDGKITVSTSPNPTQSPTTTLTPTSKPTTPDTNSDSTNSITLPLNTFAAIIVVTAVVVSIAVALLTLSLARRHRAKINSQVISP
jgi:hypothetical protein